MPDSIIVWASCNSILDKNDDIKIVLSGGYANHFNSTNESHAAISERYLIENMNFLKEK